MRVVNRADLTLSVSMHAANHHDVMLAQLIFDMYMIEVLIGDRAYDSDALGDDLRGKGIKMPAPKETEDPRWS